MECAIHPGREAVGACRRCGRPVCELCGEASNGTFVCSRCEPPSFFAEETGEGERAEAAGSQRANEERAATAAHWQRTRKSPGLAACLSACFPSLGQLYNGQYPKAFAFFVVFVALIQLADVVDLAALFIAFFYFFQLFDAYRSAEAINLTVVTSSRGDPPPPPPPPAGDSSSAEACCASTEAEGPEAASEGKKTQSRHYKHRGGGWILIVVGSAFLLQNMGFNFFSIGRMWPLILIVIGASQLWRFFGSRERQE